MDATCMDKLYEMLCKEVEEIAKKGELSAGDLDTVHKLTDTMKNIDKIEMLEEGNYSQGNGYAQNGGGWEAQGNYDRGNSYRRNYSQGRYSRRYMPDMMR